MAGLYPRGSKKWIEALDHAPENRWWVKKQRLEMLEADEQKKRQKTAEQERLAKERVEFKEMMEAKRVAKQAAREEEEKGEFRQFMRDWIATKWDGEAPDHLKKALSSGDPKDLGTLIHEWHDFKPNKGQRAVVESSPTGFVYFVRNGGLFKIGITENMLRRMGELTPDELLNVVRCSNFQEVERELHRRFKDVRLPQTEYFRLSNQPVQEVHQLMVKLADFP